MSEKINKIFNKKNNIIIGAIHFPPLLGYPDFPGFDVAVKNSLVDLKALEEGGVDGIIVENNYDIPHKEFVDAPVADSLLRLAKCVKSATNLPMGISVLWNDYKTALIIAKKIGLKFIRVPVFVDIVETNYGKIEGDAKKITSFRKSIGADDVALFTDIHVKHSKILSKHTITESAKLAIGGGADAIIVTGKWTGDAPDLNELKEVRKAVGEFPILCGSGVDANNIKTLFQYANGTIVSTSLKEGGDNKNEVNVRPYNMRISTEKVRALLSEINGEK